MLRTTASLGKANTPATVRSAFLESTSRFRTSNPGLALLLCFVGRRASPVAGQSRHDRARDRVLGFCLYCVLLLRGIPPRPGPVGLSAPPGGAAVLSSATKYFSCPGRP